jgi:hypothetical protein
MTQRFFQVKRQPMHVTKAPAPVEHEIMVVAIIRAIVGVVTIITGVHQQVPIVLAFAHRFHNRFNVLVA